MPHGGGGGHGGWGHGGRPWGAWGGGGGDWGGPPPLDPFMPGPPMPMPMMGPVPMIDASMAASGYAEIVGAEEIVGWMPAPPHVMPEMDPRHFHHHDHHPDHDHFHHVHHEAGRYEMGCAPPPGYGAGFLPDYEMGYAPPPGYGAGFLPDYEMGLAPGEVLHLNDRRGLPLQGGYELGWGAGEDFGHLAKDAGMDALETSPIGAVASLTRGILGHHGHHDHRTWDEHAARRGWDQGRDWHAHGAPLPPGAPIPPHDWHHHDQRRW